MVLAASPGEVTLLLGTPRQLPVGETQGRTVVLDIALAGDDRVYRKVTGRFLSGLGEDLAAWVDHHGHERHAEFAADPRFVLATKQEHPSCAEMVAPELVERIGPVETIVFHGDLDGIYSAAIWLRGGREPYSGAVADARAADSRQGKLSAFGLLVDQALRGRLRDEALRIQLVRRLAETGPTRDLEAMLQPAAREFARRVDAARQRAEGYRVLGPLAVVELDESDRAFDKTELLLAGQQRALVAVVRQGPYVTMAAPFDSGVDLVAILGLRGGMPTRVSVTTKDFPGLLERLRRALESGGGTDSSEGRQT